MAGIAHSIYNTLIKRNYIFVSTVFVGAFGLQLAFDTASDSLWNNVNKGRQWKDIKHRYLEKEDEDEDDE